LALTFTVLVALGLVLFGLHQLWRRRCSRRP